MSYSLKDYRAFVVYKIARHERKLNDRTFETDYKELADELGVRYGKAFCSKIIGYFRHQAKLPLVLDFCQQLGTPLSQSSNGDLVLSIRNESYGKEDQEPVDPILIVGLVFIPTDVMLSPFFASIPQKRR